MYYANQHSAPTELALILHAINYKRFAPTELTKTTLI